MPVSDPVGRQIAHVFQREVYKFWQSTQTRSSSLNIS